MTEFPAGQPEPPRRTVATASELMQLATPDLISEILGRARYVGKAEQPAGSQRTGDPQRARDELLEAETVLRARVRTLEAGPSSSIDNRGVAVTDDPPQSPR